MNYPNFYPSYMNPNVYQNSPQQGIQMPVQPMQPQQSVITPSLAYRLVSSEEEARNAQIAFDGTRSVFADFEHGKIYTKMFDLRNGTFPFEVYELVKEQKQEIPEFKVEYVPAPKFEDTVNDILERIDDLYSEIDRMKPRKAARKNDDE